MVIRSRKGQLFVSLTLFSLLLQFFAFGSHAFYSVGVVALTPALLAVTILPVPLGLLSATISLIVGRALAHLGEPDALLFAASSTVVLWLPLLLHRLGVAWQLRWGFAAFPLAMLVVDTVAQRFMVDGITRLLHAPVDVNAVHIIARGLSLEGASLLVWLLPAVVAALGTGGFGTYQWPAPFVQAEREKGLVVASVVGLLAFLLLFAVGNVLSLLGVHGEGAPQVQAVVFVAAVLCLIVVGQSLKNRWRLRNR